MGQQSPLAGRQGGGNSTLLCLPFTPPAAAPDAFSSQLRPARGAGAGSELLLAHGLAGAEAQRGRGAEKLEVGKFIVAPTEFVAGVSRQLARN